MSFQDSKLWSCNEEDFTIIRSNITREECSMERSRLICVVTALCLLVSASSALAANSVVIESKNAAAASTIHVGIAITNDVALKSITLPLVIVTPPLPAPSSLR
jgi:hypothetical protein